MEVIRKKNCTIILKDELDKEKVFRVEELEINGDWVSFKTSGNLITIPVSRIIKIKEGLEE